MHASGAAPGDRARRGAGAVVALCAAINILDGFDIMAMAYIAPAVAREWHLPPERVGLLLSAGLAGMMLGAMILGPVADRVGRRPVVLACLLLAGTGMALAACAPTLAVLGLLRFVTGLAIGGLLPALNSIVAEHAPRERRGLAVGLMQSGFAVGATIGGVAATGILAQWGWRGVLAAGAAASVPLLLWCWRGLPESLPDSRARPADVSGVGARSGLGRAWWLLLGAFTSSMVSLYFLLSWTPKVLADAGLAEKAAVFAGAMLTAGGLLAALAIGWIAARRPLAPPLAAVALAAAVATAVFGSLQLGAWATAAAAFVLGLLINAVQVGLYALCPALFPRRIRAGATGLAIGLGRSGAVAGPALAGWLLAAGAPKPILFAIMALPYGLAAFFIVRLKPHAVH